MSRGAFLSTFSLADCLLPYLEITLSVFTWKHLEIKISLEKQTLSIIRFVPVTIVDSFLLPQPVPRDSGCVWCGCGEAASVGILCSPHFHNSFQLWRGRVVCQSVKMDWKIYLSEKLVRDVLTVSLVVNSFVLCFVPSGKSWNPFVSTCRKWRNLLG